METRFEELTEQETVYDRLSSMKIATVEEHRIEIIDTIQKNSSVLVEKITITDHSDHQIAGK